MTAVYLSAGQVADRLGVHPRTVHRYIREGRLTASRIGNRYRIAPAEVTAFLGDDAETASLEAAPAAEARVSVDVWDVSVERADRVRALILGAANSRERDHGALDVTVGHEPDAGHLRVSIRGSLQHASAVLALLVVVQEQ